MRAGTQERVLGGNIQSSGLVEAGCGVGVGGGVGVGVGVGQISGFVNGLLFVLERGAKPHAEVRVDLTEELDRRTVVAVVGAPTKGETAQRRQRLSLTRSRLTPRRHRCQVRPKARSLPGTGERHRDALVRRFRCMALFDRQAASRGGLSYRCPASVDYPINPQHFCQCRAGRFESSRRLAGSNERSRSRRKLSITVLTTLL